MAAISNYAETLMLNWLFTAGAVTRPTAWYVALYTAAPSDAGGGTEVAGNGYARQALASTVTGDTASNSGELTFAADGGNWGSITHIGIFDASSGGNLLWHGPITTPRTINDGDELKFAVGEIDLPLD